MVVGGQQVMAGNAQGSSNNYPLQKKNTNYVSPYSQKKQWQWIYDFNIYLL